MALVLRKRQFDADPRSDEIWETSIPLNGSTMALSHMIRSRAVRFRPRINYRLVRPTLYRFHRNAHVSAPETIRNATLKRFSNAHTDENLAVPKLTR